MRYIHTIFLTLLAWSLGATAAEKITLSSASAGMTLKNDCIYVLSADQVTIAAAQGESGLKVAENSFAVISIDEGQVLCVYGGNGDFFNEAGAGIEVPQSSRLYILGKGTLYAYGGSAGNGSAGEAGEDGHFSSNHHDYWGGTGGSGGNGGGGAGAGIGGRGGRGGQGGPSMVAQGLRDVDPSDNGYDGVAGERGSNGFDGQSMGDVYVVGSALVVAYPGGTGSTPSQLTNCGATIHKNFNLIFGNDYYAGGGGGGGNGASGFMPNQGFAGGGAGASGAGGGASGAIFNQYTADVNFLMTMLPEVLELAGDVVFFEDLPVLSIIGDMLEETTGYDKIDWAAANLSGSHGLGSYAPSGKRVGNSFVDNYRVNTFHCISGKYDIVSMYGGLSGDPGVNGKDGTIYQLKGYTPRIFNGWGSDEQPADTKVIDEMPEELANLLRMKLHFDGSDLASGTPADRELLLGDVLEDIDASAIKHKDGEKNYRFAGFVDAKGRKWFDQQGHGLVDVDSKGVSHFFATDDVTLTPLWQEAQYGFVIHWKERLDASAANADEDNFLLYDIQVISSFVNDKGEANFQGDALTITGFECQEPSTQTHVEAYNPNWDTLPNVGDYSGDIDALLQMLKNYPCINFHYKRSLHSLAWELKEGMDILDSDDPSSPFYHEYTKSGDVRFGQTIVYPKFVSLTDAYDQGLMQLDGWTVSGNEEDSYIMPDNDIAFLPVLSTKEIPVNILSNHGSVSVADNPRLELSKSYNVQTSMKANVMQNIYVKADAGWQVSNLTVQRYTKSQDGSLHVTTDIIDPLTSPANAFALRALGEKMNITVNFAPVAYDFTLRQDMYANSTPKAMVSLHKDDGTTTALQVDETKVYKEGIDAHSRIRVYIASSWKQDEYLDRIILREGNAQHMGRSIDYQVGQESYKDESGNERYKQFVEFVAPANNVYMGFTIAKQETEDMNKVVITAVDGMHVEYGNYLDPASQHEVIAPGTTTFTDGHVVNREVIRLRVSEKVHQLDIQQLDERQQVVPFEGNCKLVESTSGSSTFLVSTPATTSSTTFLINIGVHDPVGYVKMKDESGTINILQRDGNNITFQESSDIQKFCVPTSMVAFPTAEGGKAGADNTLHIRWTRQFADDATWQTFCVPFTFAVTEAMDAQIEIGEYRSMAKMEGSKYYSLHWVTIHVGDSVYANKPYIIRGKKMGDVELQAETKLWDATQPIPTTIASPIDEQEDFTLIPVYECVHPIDLYPEKTQDDYLWKLQDNQFKYILKSTVQITPWGFYGKQYLKPTYGAGGTTFIDNDGDGLADNVSMPMQGGGQPTGIESVRQNTTPGAYDLTGRRLSDLRHAGRGIYIVGGKKVVKLK